MFSVEVSYLTRLGNLRSVMTTAQTLGTRAEAEEVRDALRARSDLAAARISIVNAPPPTVDTVMAHFRRQLEEYPVLVSEPA